MKMAHSWGCLRGNKSIGQGSAELAPSSLLFFFLFFKSHPAKVS